LSQKPLESLSKRLQRPATFAGDDLNGHDVRGDRTSPFGETSDKDLRKNQALPNPIPV
jgi:hypothetical protein